eukprot:755757-Hanusia_phi.AAC.2
MHELRLSKGERTEYFPPATGMEHLDGAPTSMPSCTLHVVEVQLKGGCKSAGGLPLDGPAETLVHLCCVLGLVLALLLSLEAEEGRRAGQVEERRAQGEKVGAWYLIKRLISLDHLVEGIDLQQCLKRLQGRSMEKKKGEGSRRQLRWR